MRRSALSRFRAPAEKQEHASLPCSRTSLTTPPLVLLSMASPNGKLLTIFSFLVFSVVVGSSASMQWGNTTGFDARDAYLSPPSTRIQELYTLTGPVSADRVTPTSEVEASRKCLQATIDLFAGNYTNGVLVRPPPAFCNDLSLYPPSFIANTTSFYSRQMLLYSGKEPGDYGNVRFSVLSFPSLFCAPLCASCPLILIFCVLHSRFTVSLPLLHSCSTWNARN